MSCLPSVPSQANYSVTKSDGKNYNNVFLTVKIEHVAKNHEFYAIPVSRNEI